MQHQIDIWQEIFGAHWTQFVETYRPFIGLVTVRMNQEGYVTANDQEQFMQAGWPLNNVLDGLQEKQMLHFLLTVRRCTRNKDEV